MSLVVTPAVAAADDEAPLTERAPKIPVLIPACCRVSFSYRVMVDEDTGLCGFTIATNSLAVPSGHRGEVMSIYRHRVVTGHNSLLCGKVGKSTLSTLSRLLSQGCRQEGYALRAKPTSVYL